MSTPQDGRRGRRPSSRRGAGAGIDEPAAGAGDDTQDARSAEHGAPASGGPEPGPGPGYGAQWHSAEPGPEPPYQEQPPGPWEQQPEGVNEVFPGQAAERHGGHGGPAAGPDETTWLPQSPGGYAGEPYAGEPYPGEPYPGEHPDPGAGPGAGVTQQPGPPLPADLAAGYTPPRPAFDPSVPGDQEFGVPGGEFGHPGAEFGRPGADFGSPGGGSPGGEFGPPDQPHSPGPDHGFGYQDFGQPDSGQGDFGQQGFGQQGFGQPDFGPSGGAVPGQHFDEPAEPGSPPGYGPGGEGFQAPGGDFGSSGGGFGLPGGDFALPGGDFGPPGGDFGSPGQDFRQAGTPGMPPAPPDVPVPPGPRIPPPAGEPVHIEADPADFAGFRGPPAPPGARTGDTSTFAGPAPAAGAPSDVRRDRPARPARPRIRPRIQAAGRPGTQGREANVTLTRVEPLSVLKFSFVVSVVAFIVLFVAVALLYGVLAGLGVFDSLQKTIESLTAGQGSSGVNAAQWFSASRILGYAALFGAINIFLITALSTVGAVLYNAAAHLIGGVEVTLNETE